MLGTQRLISEHLLIHGASIYNGHLRGTVTLTGAAERLAMELFFEAGIRTHKLPNER